MLVAAVSGTGLEAFGLMVLPYAISVLCTAIGIVPLMVFLAFGRENKKQRMVRVLSSWLSIVLLNGVATAVYNLTGLENLYLYTALATAGITYVLVKNLVVSVQRQKRQMSVVLYNKNGVGSMYRIAGFRQSFNHAIKWESGTYCRCSPAAEACR